MYTKEQLEQYPFFREKLDTVDIENLLDPLTGLVSRGQILWFVQWLIEHETPFSFAMLDLDNFKFINDTYGHHAGDQVLASVAGDVISILDGIGVAGRFGGDEFLMVNLKDVTYEDCKAFFTRFYEGKVLRKNIRTDDCSPFVTGTVGCAIYPRDATDYNELFSLIDKTLYRGKSKGRNCHIIYVEEKHKNIVIKQIARHGMYTTLSALVRQFEFAPGIINKLRSVMPLLMEELQISDLYYVGEKNVMHAVRNQTLEIPVQGLEELLRSDDVFADNSLEEVNRRSPEFYQVLQSREVETFCAVRIILSGKKYGYLICAEPRNRRIWQEAECAILYFLSKMLASTMALEGDQLD